MGMIKCAVFSSISQTLCYLSVSLIIGQSQAAGIIGSHGVCEEFFISEASYQGIFADHFLTSHRLYCRRTCMQLVSVFSNLEGLCSCWSGSNLGTLLASGGSRRVETCSGNKIKGKTISLY